MSASIPPFDPGSAAGCSRRAFIGQVATGGLAMVLPFGEGEQSERLARPRVADRWSACAEGWEREPGVVNLENGGVQAAHRRVTDAYVAAWRRAQVNASRTLAREQGPLVEPVRAELASAFGCQVEELALMRNTTEAVETILLGLELQAGDRVLTTTRDYWRFHDTLQQRAARDGVIVDVVKLPPAEDGDDAVVAAVAAAIGGRTRLALISQVVNLTGRVLPVARLCVLLRERGVLSLVDGAHGFGQLEDTAATLGCDFYGTSLHKWLGAPHGTGFLFLRRALLSRVWPHFGAGPALAENVRKFESIGTVPLAPVLAIRAALELWREVGPAVKLQRLRWLRERWLAPVLELPAWSAVDRPPAAGGTALATVTLAGVDPAALSRWLWDTHRQIVRPIEHAEFAGIRVTPNLANTADELDRFVRILAGAARSLGKV